MLITRTSLVRRRPRPSFVHIAVGAGQNLSISYKNRNIFSGDAVHEAFNYSSGRWLYNEKARLDERHRMFNLEELPRIAARSIRRAQDEVKSVRKLAEGGFNRVFEITMSNNRQLIARLPYPSTYPESLATASEVATMEFVRLHGIPCPQVHEYSCNSRNQLGSEYIIMEKLNSRSLGEYWFDMSQNQMANILKAIADLEAKLFTIKLPAFGSLFFPTDLPSNFDRIAVQSPSPQKQFCVGPDVSIENWFQERTLLDIDRGPFTNSAQLLKSVAAKEAAWLLLHGKPRLPWNRAHRESIDWKVSQPSDYLQCLEQYIAISPHLVPKPTWLNQPILRHPDLQPNNIFVSENFNVAGLIDWQHTQILPLFLHAGIPKSFQNYQDLQSQVNIEPSLPDDLERMPEEERTQALELFRRRQLHFYYLAAQAQSNSIHFRACSYELGLFRRKIFLHAGAPWEGNNIPLQADLIKVQQNWATLTQSGVACPLTFAEEEIGECYARLNKQDEADEMLADIRSGIGIASDGWVPSENYEQAVAAAARIKMAALECCETDRELELSTRHWPFDDHDEDE